MPMASFDLHVEAPSLKRKRMTHFDVQHENSRVIFNKTIQGRYRDGKVGYEEVGVFFITWEKDDLFCKSKEVDRLQKIFKARFGFTTETYEIPSERSETSFCRAVSDFAFRYDSPNKLSIIYYGGHGAYEEGKLQLFAKLEGDGDGDPAAFFSDVVQSLKLPDTDILLVVDCCFAAQAFARQEFGKRKFELLSATPPGQRARSPSQPGSFTRNLSDTLDELLAQHPKGFSTSKLYREVYFKQEEKIKPFLFDQSKFDYGKIWLRPFASRVNASVGEDAQNDGHSSNVTIDLRLSMTRMPESYEMNELARALQYLPHVQQLQFQQLRAPDAELGEFIRGLKKAMVLKPLVARLRRRLAEKRMRQQGLEPPQSPLGCPSQSPLNTRLRDSSLYDWSKSVAEFEDGSQLPVHESKQAGLSRTASLHEPHETISDAKTHSVGNLFSYAYILDLSGAKAVCTQLKSRILRFSLLKTARRRLLFGILLFFLSFSYAVRPDVKKIKTCNWPS